MPNLNHAVVIVAEVLPRLAERPFEPFVLVLFNGSGHEVPTPDHCTVQRFSRRINADHDDGSFVTINALHIAQIELLHEPQRRFPRLPGPLPEMSIAPRAAQASLTVSL